METTRLELELPRLAPEFDGYRVVQISDLHARGRTVPERLAGLLRPVNEQRPDLIAITGDLADRHANFDRVAPGLVRALRSLRARDGVFAVLGNHDHRIGSHRVRRVLRASGIIELPNTHHTLRREGAALHLAGVDDHMEFYDRLDVVLERLPDSGSAILLAHEPDFADISAPAGRFDLQLSGHSHGGQIRLPTPLILPPYGEKYPAGLYQVKGMLLYTNRGLGAVRPRIRLNCPPEITALTLHSPAR
ncbi:metallophosphoesterase [Rubrobacter taiwanensis]|uniref:metallophosphoesterase n=1 Tax=Rubrobacter taiwanensis TaxID=185139 RepID=UPI001404AE4F|nr:metallophosphoesterase [Rubrobacter taiwanensis]